MRLEHEAKLLKQMRCRWWAPVLETGREGDDLYLVMSYVPGASLQARLSEGPLGVDEAVQLGRCLCEALDELHARRDYIAMSHRAT